MCNEVCSLILPITFGAVGILILFCGMVWYCYYVTYKQPYQSSYSRRRYTSWLNSTTNLVEPEKKGDYLKNLITDRFLYHTQLKDYLEQDLQELKEISPVFQDNCVICLMKYKHNTPEVFVGLLKSCGHYFHFSCIWEWLQQKQTCPVCRKPCTLDETNLKGFSLAQVLQSTEDGQDPNACKSGGSGETNKFIKVPEAKLATGEHSSGISEAVCTTGVHCSLSSSRRINGNFKEAGVPRLPDVEETSTLDVN